MENKIEFISINCNGEEDVSGMTTQEKWEEIYNVLDDMSIKYDTNYCGSETEALIEFWTDTARQDIPTEFDYDGTPEDFVKQFTERAEMYDVDEEVELFVGMRGKNGVPNTIRELFDDCQEAKDTLMEIAKKLQKAIKNAKEIKTMENKFMIQVARWMYSDEKGEYTEWQYLGTEGKLKLIITENNITENTKIFNSAKEAGEYVDKMLEKDYYRINFADIRIVVEVED